MIVLHILKLLQIYTHVWTDPKLKLLVYFNTLIRCLLSKMLNILQLSLSFFSFSLTNSKYLIRVLQSRNEQKTRNLRWKTNLIKT